MNGINRTWNGGETVGNTELATQSYKMIRALAFVSEVHCTYSALHFYQVRPNNGDAIGILGTAPNKEETEEPSFPCNNLITNNWACSLAKSKSSFCAINENRIAY